MFGKAEERYKCMLIVWTGSEAASSATSHSANSNGCLDMIMILKYGEE